MPDEEPKLTILGPRFEQALLFASQMHARQRRKDTGAPYIAHVMGVTALVLEDGGSEEEVIAALLHDSAEDQGGEQVLVEIRKKYGDKIAAIVYECSDTLDSPKPPWKGRKQGHLTRLEDASREALHIMLADKVYNSRSLLRGLQERGPEIWGKFKGGKEGTLWYFHQMLALFQKHFSGYLVNELARVVVAIEAISEED